MANRQVIGLRKPKVTQRKRGRERREKMVKAAYDLLCAREIEDISFRDIAAQADVPEGSAYHFFANRFDVFTALAKTLSEDFIAAHQRPVPAAKRQTWQDLAAYLVDVGAAVYASSPPARQLFLGSKTPPEIKLADRVNDEAVGRVMHNVFSRYFDIPDTDEMQRVFFYFIELTDLFFSLSVIEHHTITPHMLAEAKRAGVGYLATYFKQPRGFSDGKKTST
ncbi:MAG: TetR/AcrR family transcriptional regulator [Pseudomonadota bacterium]